MAIGLFVGRNLEQNHENNWFINDVVTALTTLAPQLDIRVWPNLGNKADIEFALAWLAPFNIFNDLPNLKGISSLGAGVDHLLADPNLPKHIPIMRVVDPYMANDIVQYVVVCVLNYMKRMDHWREKQKENSWFKQPPFNLSHQTIGVMGVGHLGRKAIDALLQLGLKVIGWSHSPKTIPGSKQYAGEQELSEFLAHTSVLICMLPLTTKTRGILNRENFDKLVHPAYIINVGRGAHLVENDLLAAIEDGKIVGAALDVFEQEPLPLHHPFWQNPAIRVTPHIASITNANTVAPQILENYQRLLNHEPLLNLINRAKGY